MLTLNFLLETTIVDLPEMEHDQDREPDVSRLADYRHPAIQKLAHKLAADFHSDTEKVKHLFLYVRDSILFGFPPEFEGMKASEVLEAGMGHCNAKTTLFLALCKASGVEARVHYAAIDIQILKGLVPWWAFPFMPRKAPTSWVEVKLGDRWHRIDTYINDKRFCEAAWEKLKEEGLQTGYSLSSNQPISCQFCLQEEGFHHMGALLNEDYGIYDDPAEFLASPHYQELPIPVKATYPYLRNAVNNRIQEIRDMWTH